jgi:tyrosinase
MGVTRRTFLRTTGVATAALVGSTLFDGGPLFAAPPFTRKSIMGLASGDAIITGYKNAITAMKALAGDNPLSWTYQAAIHGTNAGGSHTSWNSCEHGTFYFLSWHRMYLYYFERIVRMHSGNANWALPYWNYTPAGDPRKLPPVFRNPNNNTNALWVSNRGAGWNAGTSSFGNSTVNTSTALGNVPFGSFQNDLEGTPHDDVHIAMGGLMGDVPTAAQDPIFYLHHCNIDRLWNAWLAQGGGRSNPLSNSAQDQAWRDTKFTFFDAVAPKGKEVQLTGCQILRAQAQLQYNYEGEPAQVNQFCKLIINPKWLKDIVLILDRPFKIPPGPDPEPFQFDISKLRARLATLAGDNASDLMLELSVEADRQPDVFYEVYVGLPKGARATSDSPFYVGNVSLFGRGIRNRGHQHGEFKPAEFSFKIDRAVASALKRTDDGGRLSVRFVPKAAEGEGNAATRKANATLNVGRAAIAVARVSQKG